MPRAARSACTPRVISVISAWKTLQYAALSSSRRLVPAAERKGPYWIKDCRPSQAAIDNLPSPRRPTVEELASRERPKDNRKGTGPWTSRLGGWSKEEEDNE
jgi:hypothetical protein